MYILRFISNHPSAKCFRKFRNLFYSTALLDVQADGETDRDVRNELEHLQVACLCKLVLKDGGMPIKLALDLFQRLYPAKFSINALTLNIQCLAERTILKG
jgi:hypothetical protein